MRRKLKDYLLVTLKGVGMGAADVVPGVSGGTIAFISGIYEELINSIKSINFSSFKQLFKNGIKDFWISINGNFLLAVFVGILISVFSLARILKYILDNNPVLVWSFFFGLIIASAIFISKKAGEWNFSILLTLIIGGIVAYFITIITPAETTNAYWFIFLSGALAICAMILPGISGAFILLLLGKYKFILGAIIEVKMDVIMTLGCGAIIGLLVFSNLLSWLLKKYHNLTIALLSGFMLGSLNKVWPWKIIVSTFTNINGEIKPLVEKNVLPDTYFEFSHKDPQLFYSVLLAIAGFCIIFFIEKFSNKSKTV